MLQRFKRGILLQGLTLLLFAGSCEASSLGLTVHVEPLQSYEGQKVRAHFSAITPGPCQSSNELCDSDEDCLVHKTSLPFIGTKPAPGWCVSQWQKTVSSTFRSSISVGSNTEVFVAIKAAPEIRENSGRLNRPPYVGLLPPVRARVGCPHHLDLSVKDLDGDKVRCRFARQGLGECSNCPQHSFVELNEEKCNLQFDGKAEPGQYFIYLMAEDFIPAPPSIQLTNNKPLSSVPVHISLTVEESTTKCSDEPVATGETPEEDFMMFVLPYQEVKIDINYESQRESVSEVAVVGPPDLHRVNFKSVGPFASMTMAWVRSENNSLPHLIPICFAVNTKNLQSDPRCVWLYQRELRALPDGTVLKCEKTSMTLVLPIASLKNINLAELQLNSATCPVTYNSTHLTATISLDGCGTKTVHSGSELVYTNTLQSVHPFTKVSRTPSLILPLACRIPGVQAKGPQYQIAIPKEEETFGLVSYWLEMHTPGNGPLARFTRIPRLRSLRMPPVQTRLNTVLRSENTVFSSTSTSSTNNNTSNDHITFTTPPYSSNNSTNSSGIDTTTRSNRTTTRQAIGSWLDVLDLHVMSNCTMDRAEMVVSKCIRSKTPDFIEFIPILEQGCSTSNSTLEVLTTKAGVRVYRLYLSTMENKETTMYVECIVNLCIATLPSQKCPDLCTRTFTPKTLVDSVYTQSYTIRSGPVSLVVTTPAPATTMAAKTTAGHTTKTTTTTTVASTAQNTTSSHAPEKTSAMAAGVVLTTISIFLQKVFLY